MRQSGAGWKNDNDEAQEHAGRFGVVTRINHLYPSKIGLNIKYVWDGLRVHDERAVSRRGVAVHK